MTRGAVGLVAPEDAMLDTLPCGVLTFSDDGRILRTNATLRALLGYQAEELEGRHVEGILTIAGRIFYQTHFFPLLRLQGAVSEIFLLLRRSDGTELGALTNGARREQDGEMLNTCIVIEVRERRKYEDELLRARRTAEGANAALAARTRELEDANERLEEQAAELEMQQEQLLEQSLEVERARTAAEDANRAKSQFLATMSHELRTPLNAIGGYVQLMEIGIHGPLTDAQRESLQRIARSQRHLLRLVNEVLNLARIEAGHVDYLTEPVSIAEVVASVVPMVEPQMAARALELEVSVPDGLRAHADRDKVQQVLINLLTNAVKFTPPGGRIAITAGPDDLHDRVLVTVRDTGIGIAKDKLEGIFEPFIQVDVSPTRSTEGTGLGLAISRDLARGMQGDLMVHSELGTGSVFTLSLPMDRPAQQGPGGA